jgi:hypothetical protein
MNTILLCIHYFQKKNTYNCSYQLSFVFLLTSKINIRDGGKLGSVWWRQLVGIRRGEEMVVGRWFDDNLVRVVGDGTRTFF